MKELLIVAGIWIGLRVVLGAWLPRFKFRDPNAGHR